MPQNVMALLVITAVGCGVNVVATVVKQERWPATSNYFASVLLSAAGGVLIVASGAGFSRLSDPTALTTTILAVVGAAQTIYHAVYKHTLDQAIKQAISSQATPAA